MTVGHRAAIEVTTGFNPLAFLLYFSTPTIEIDGIPHRRSWGRHVFPVAPGLHTVRVYFRYLFAPEVGDNSIEADVLRGSRSRIRYHMPPWVFAKGSLEELDPAEAPDLGEATKRCSRCAEDVRVEARVCAHCGHEFDEASIEVERSRAEAQQEAAKAQLAVRREAGEQLRLFHRHRRSLAWARVCWVSGGIFLLLAFAGLVAASTGATAHGPGDPVQMTLGNAFLGVLLLVGGFALKRKSGGVLEVLNARTEEHGDRYHCRCGRAKYPYYWLHVALCFLFPYGLIGLLFPLKRCRSCGTRYSDAALAAL